jgi:hypothetical protein
LFHVKHDGANGAVSKEQFRTIFSGLLPDGLDVRMLTPSGRAEIRRALEVLLEQAEREEDAARRFAAPHT